MTKNSIRAESSHVERWTESFSPMMRIVCSRRASFSSTNAFVSCETGKSWLIVLQRARAERSERKGAAQTRRLHELKVCGRHITSPMRKPTAEKKMFCWYRVVGNGVLTSSAAGGVVGSAPFSAASSKAYSSTSACVT